MRTDPQSAKPPITLIVDYLLKKYRVQLDLPNDANRLATLFHERTKGGEKTLRNIFQGSTENPTDKTCHHLVTFFRPAVPHIKPVWFLSRSVEEFVQRMRFSGGLVWFDMNIPFYSDQEAVNHFTTRWVGTYLGYRLSFDGNTADDVTCEVYDIRKDEHDPVLDVSMSFLPQPRAEPHHFVGKVLPFGQSLFFIAANTGNVGPGNSENGRPRNSPHHDRARSLFLADAQARKAMEDCKLGILTSTRDFDSAPCSACTLLVKVQWEPTELHIFTKEATRMDTWENIIHADFGTKHDKWLKAFLDNVPLGRMPAPDTRRADAPLDSVLRLNIPRFYEQMPHILQDVLDDSKIFAPFKQNWQHRPHPLGCDAA